MQLTASELQFLNRKPEPPTYVETREVLTETPATVQRLLSKLHGRPLTTPRPSGTRSARIEGVDLIEVIGQEVAAVSAPAIEYGCTLSGLWRADDGRILGARGGQDLAVVSQVSRWLLDNLDDLTARDDWWCFAMDLAEARKQSHCYVRAESGPRWMTEPEAVIYVGRSARTLRDWRSQGTVLWRAVQGEDAPGSRRQRREYLSTTLAAADQDARNRQQRSRFVADSRSSEGIDNR